MTEKYDFISALEKRHLKLTKELTNENLKWSTTATLVCSNGHTFSARIDNVLRLDRPLKINSGCKECAKQKLYESSKAIAAKNLINGHKLIREEVKKTGSDQRKERFFIAKCQYGHEYKKQSGSLKEGCPECNVKINLGQERTRLIFEELFNKKFNQCRPNWLENPDSGLNLELDGFCEDLNIAFEYQGKQHLENNTMYSSDYENQTRRDQIKRDLCAKNKVVLIEVTQPKNYDQEKFLLNVLEQIEDKTDLAKNKIKITTDLKKTIAEKMKSITHLSLEKLYSNFNEYVKNSGYSLISKNLTTMKDFLIFECPEKHKFEMTGEKFKQHFSTAYRSENITPCPCAICNVAINKMGRVRDAVIINEDGGKQIMTRNENKTEVNRAMYHSSEEKLEDIRSFAQKKEYKLLTQSILNIKDEMEFECKDGHQFKMTGEHFKQHYSTAYRNNSVAPCPCRVCKEKNDPNARIKHSLDSCKDLAKSMGWSVVSPEYTSKNAPMVWSCQNGHQVETTLRLMLRESKNNKCPECVSLTKTKKSTPKI